MILKRRHIAKLVAHISFWIILVVVLNSQIMNIVWGPFARSAGTLLVPLVFGTVINAVLLYSNALWLIPTFLQKKRYDKFWTYSSLLIICLTVLESGFDIFYLNLKGSLYIDTTGEVWHVEDTVIFCTTTFIINIFFWAMAFLYRLPFDWVRNERHKQELKQAQLTAELDFLKAQINPHFLFNGINSIYHLIGSDDDQARNVLLKFSDLLRYQLYECSDDFIPLKKEIKYLKNYIGIEKIRKESDATITVEWPATEILENIEGEKIAPLLLSPFIENAFKYLSHHTDKTKNTLDIRFDYVNHMLNLFVSNTSIPNSKYGEKKNLSGIGLANVKKRLKLLYPDQYQLNISKDSEKFSVSLKLRL